MTEKILLIVFIFFTLSTAEEQNTKRNQAVFINFGGQAPLLSVNYEVGIRENQFCFQFGGGMLLYFYTAHFGINYLYGNIHYLETGIGLLNLIEFDNNIFDINTANSYFTPNIWLGYRYGRSCIR